MAYSGDLHFARTHGRLGRCPMKSSRSCGGSRTASRGNMDTMSSASPPVFGAGNRRRAGGSWTCAPCGRPASEARWADRGPGMTNRWRSRGPVVRHPVVHQGVRRRAGLCGGIGVISGPDVAERWREGERHGPERRRRRSAGRVRRDARPPRAGRRPPADRRGRAAEADHPVRLRRPGAGWDRTATSIC